MIFKRRTTPILQPEKRGGQATIELALVISVLFFFLMGVADVARIFVEQQAVVHAAGVGARWMTLDANAKACAGYYDVTSVVYEDIGTALPRANIQSITTSTASNPDQVTVTVTYVHSFFFGLINNFPTSFSGHATMPGDPSLGGTCPTPANATPTRTPVVQGTPTNTPTNTRTSTPTPTFTRTPIPTDTVTPTWTPSPTNTATVTPSNTPTSTPTFTQTPTSTPTPFCPYKLANVDGYKNQGLNPLYVRATVQDQAGRGIPGVNVTVTILSTPPQSIAGTTDASGAVCLNPGTDAANRTNFRIDVSGGTCGPLSQTFQSQFNNVHTCP